MRSRRCEAVRDGGAAALRDLSQRYDGCALSACVSQLTSSPSPLTRLDPDVRAALEVSIARARPCTPTRCGPTRPPGSPRGASSPNGGFLSTGSVSASRGRAVYPSSVVMNVASRADGPGSAHRRRQRPPQRENTGAPAGYPHLTIRRVRPARRRGEVYAIGGAQAIAAFAFGFTDGDDVCEPVSLVTGPGNIWRRRGEASSGPDRHRRRGWADRDRCPPTRAPTRSRRRRPGQPGRARPTGCERPVTDDLESAEAVCDAVARRAGSDEAQRARPEASPVPSRRSSLSMTSTRAGCRRCVWRGSTSRS